MTGMIRKKKTRTSAGARKGRACSPPSRIADNRRPGGFPTTDPGATVPLLISSRYPLFLAAERVREEVGTVEDEGRRACNLRGLLLDQLVRVRGRLHALVRRDDGARRDP